MPFLLIQGVFNPHSGSPDGDSVRFRAQQPQLFRQLKNRIDIKENGEVQLRYEGIDALEKKALTAFARAATQANIQLLGGDQDALPGYILAGYGDANGRPVCFVFTGEPPVPNGNWLQLHATALRQSINYQLLQRGLVYPLFYDSLYQELRRELIAATDHARQQQLGLWPTDRSNQGFDLQRAAQLAELPPIFPKLWRRLEQFYHQHQREHFALLDFKQWLAQGEDRVFTLPDQRCIKFATAISVQPHALKMIYRPEEMLFGSSCGL
jgi:endonuclease YncB( thermonuclease family)